MLTVTFPQNVPDSALRFAVILATHQGKMVFCQHRERDTLEMPGGRREPGEAILDTARRELQEETGAVDFDLQSVCCYAVTGKTRYQEDGSISWGLLCRAEIHSFGEIHSEMQRIVLLDSLPGRMTYPQIQPALHEECRHRGLI